VVSVVNAKNASLFVVAVKEMISALTTGILFGLSSGLAPGPLLALVVAQTLKHDANEGMKVAAAPLLTDLPIILVSVFILTRFLNYRGILGGISLLGGIYVSYLAYESLKTKPVTFSVSETEPHSFRKGWWVNTLSPHPYLFWITVGTPFILKSWEQGLLPPATFVLSFFVSLVGSKMLLALFIGRSRSFLTRSTYLWVMRSLGAILTLFALFLFKEGLTFLEVLWLARQEGILSEICLGDF
jgi:threonine/homoserine/homoserine lactone efflux protein